MQLYLQLETSMFNGNRPGNVKVGSYDLRRVLSETLMPVIGY